MAVFGFLSGAAGTAYAQETRVASPQEHTAAPVSAADFFQRPEVRAVIKDGYQQRTALLEKARDLVRSGKLNEAISQYELVSRFRITVPNAPEAYSQVCPSMSEQEEWADVLEKVGRTDETMKMYRQLVYQSGFLEQNTDIAQKGTMLDESTQVWATNNTYILATNNTYILARYAQMLLATGQYDEALVVYRKALDAFYPDEYSKGLVNTLKTTNNNFDRSRFKASVYVLLAKGTVGVDAHYSYNDVVGKKSWEVAQNYLEEAIHIRSDFAPAYLLAAQIDINYAHEYKYSRQDAIRNNLDKADQFARNDELRECVKKNRARVR